MVQSRGHKLTVDDLAEWLAKPLRDLLIFVSQFIRRERFKFRSLYENSNSQFFKACLSLARNVGKNQFTIKNRSFTLMLYPKKGIIHFHPRDLEINVIEDLFLFLTNSLVDIPPGVGLSRKEALEFIHDKLELIFLELESGVIGDVNEILPNKFTQIAVTEFNPVKYFGPSTITHFVDASKNLKEIGTDGSPKEATDVQEILSRPIRVAGNLREIKSAVLDMMLGFNTLCRNQNQFSINIIREFQDQQTDLSRINRNIQIMNQDLTTLLQQPPEVDLTGTNEILREGFTQLVQSNEQNRQDLEGAIAEQTREINQINTDLISEVNQLRHELKLNHQIQTQQNLILKKEMELLELKIDSLKNKKKKRRKVLDFFRRVFR